VPEPPLNDLNLPINKSSYTTADLCSVLKISPDTLRQRIYAGHYHEPDRDKNNRRFFTESQIRLVIKLTQSFIKKGILKAGS
jgi:hypothetical protein